jgi:RNA-directed DNA polymerase
MAAEQRISPESAEVQDQPRKREESSTDVKPFKLDKWEIWKAYKEVKANRGGSGIDGQTMKDFERDLKGNLYKIWNRMSSGSYIPSAVRRAYQR